MLMRFVLPVLTVILFSSPSPAKTNVAGKDLGFHEHSVSMNQMPTKNVRVLATKKTQRRFVVANDLTDPENDDLPGSDELDLHVPYRRPNIVNNLPEADEPLSDYVQVRLAVARARAMNKYRQNYL